MSTQYPLRSPLRYPGSKRRLAKYVRQALDLNGLRPKLYVEPFAGGASVGIQMLQYDCADKMILMDRDPWITSFWKTVFFDTQWLIDKVRSTKVTLENWNRLKRSHPRSTRDQAWTCFYLNRTSFSGILEAKAGPIGGKDQESVYKIDCRFPRSSLIKRIEAVAEFRDKVHAIWNCSWEDGLRAIKLEQQKHQLPTTDVFYYLDPPFFEKAEDLYRYCFEDDDHVRLRDRLLKLRAKWLLSYDSADQVEALYGTAIKNRTNGTNHHHVDIYYSLAVLSERRIAKEVILSNLPQLPS